MSGEKLHVRVVSPWFGELDTESAFFSVHIPSGEADALLCDWAPSEELFGFKGRKAWYCCEPWCQFRVQAGGTWPGYQARLLPSEFLHHKHPDPRFRVPHVTHDVLREVVEGGERKRRAIAVVSNNGGSPWRRHPDIALRNRFITHPLVDLYGRSGWKSYRKSRFTLRAGAPENYRGEIPGDWPAEGKRQLLAEYHAAVCFENMGEPFYFTEKFVEAVSAGCVPVYHAHPTVKDGVLRGARWIDPADYAYDAGATIQAALEADASEFRQANRLWLSGAGVGGTSVAGVFFRIGEILASKTYE